MVDGSSANRRPRGLGFLVEADRRWTTRVCRVQRRHFGDGDQIRRWDIVAPRRSSEQRGTSAACGQTSNRPGNQPKARFVALAHRAGRRRTAGCGHRGTTGPAGFACPAGLIRCGPVRWRPTILPPSCATWRAAAASAPMATDATEPIHRLDAVEAGLLTDRHCPVLEAEPSRFASTTTTRIADGEMTFRDDRMLR
jgi:hypothetical protein